MSDLREPIKDIFGRWIEGRLAFNEAIDALRDLVDAEYRPGWVSVEDRLPECDSPKPPDQAWIIFSHKNGIEVTNIHPQWWKCDYRGVTHWMPLPEPPKEEPWCKWVREMKAENKELRTALAIRDPLLVQAREALRALYDEIRSRFARGEKGFDDMTRDLKTVMLAARAALDARLGGKP